MKLNNKQINDLLYILCVYGKIEERHWEESGKPKEHIYHSFKRLNKLFPLDKEVKIIGD
jgi:hypothetical protein